MWKHRIIHLGACAGDTASLTLACSTYILYEQLLMSQLFHFNSAPFKGPENATKFGLDPRPLSPAPVWKTQLKLLALT